MGFIHLGFWFLIKYVKLAFFYVKIADKEQPWYRIASSSARFGLAILVRRLKLLTWYLIVIHNLTLYWSYIKSFKTKCVVLCQQNKFVSNLVLITITPFLNCINMLYSLNFRFRCASELSAEEFCQSVINTEGKKRRHV